MKLNGDLSLGAGAIFLKCSRKLRGALAKSTSWPSVAACLWVSLLVFASAADRPWTRHAIDRSSRGADGVRLADANGDGLPDIVTGWEEGGVTRLYLNPGPTRARERWPAVTVGATRSVEDAILVDLDNDGNVDVVSSCEGDARSMWVHWGSGRASQLDPGAWKSERIPATDKRMQWMFCCPLPPRAIPGAHILVAGGKGKDATIGCLTITGTRAVGEWTWKDWHPAGWVMSITAQDMNGDGRTDVVYSDRKGTEPGCYWLENPGEPVVNTVWKRHAIGANGREVMFLALDDLDGDGLQDVIVATRPRELIWLRRRSTDGLVWDTISIPLPANAGTAKAVAAGDVDLNGSKDLVFTCEEAGNGKHGLMWLAPHGNASERKWEPNVLSGPDGIKYDLVQLMDLDADGDLDALTCEETTQLGLIWYENPTR